MNHSIEITDSLASVPSSDWDTLNTKNNPFISHSFLNCLEQHHCLGSKTGWYPQHFLLKDETGKLVGAAPCYLKTNSHGEFVFDWAWADAYHRHGLEYYPKLVCASPYSPISGTRLLAHPEHEQNRIESLLAQAIIKLVQTQNLSSAHCLFAAESNVSSLEGLGFLKRFDYQYHWQNHNYQCFDDFLAQFKSRKRKKARREREIVKENGISFEVLHGNELSEAQWQIAFQYYRQTFILKNNMPVLTLEFFLALAKNMGEQIVVVFAYHSNKIIACAINLRNEDTLYGRYWGCSDNFNALHFETCFYQGIDYCIQQGIQTFEPGAQGEHKITRGFLPVKTYSMHWIEEPGFRQPIADYLAREAEALKDYEKSLWAMSPYREKDSM